jgi:4-hydroxyphenylpyruvate dioxygenase
VSGQIFDANSVSPALEFQGFDYLEFYVGNARQAAHYYKTAFGFTPIAYCGPETGVRDRVSFVVQQENIRFVLTSAADFRRRDRTHFARHDDGVKDIALGCRRRYRCLQRTVAHGAKPVSPPEVLEDEHGRLVKSTVSRFR